MAGSACRCPQTAGDNIHTAQFHLALTSCAQHQVTMPASKRSTAVYKRPELRLLSVVATARPSSSRVWKYGCQRALVKLPVSSSTAAWP